MINKTIKTTICDIIVVFLFIIIFITSINIFGKKYITATQKYLAMFETIESKQKNATEIKLDPVKKMITSYPIYKSQYATLIIDSIDVNLPLYFGNTQDVLKKGVGQSPNGYFPGEGGTVICMAHNFSTFLSRLGEVRNGDIIKINTSYGEYNYKVFNTRIIDETDLAATSVQDEKEILYLFTCYPFENIGYATQRYLVSAELVDGGEQ